MSEPTVVLSTSDLAILVLKRNAAEFLEHAPGARGGADPLHVHQMRVATRRMRAAVHVFGDILPPDARSLSDELKWFASQLGPVRDLDVQVHRLQESASALSISDAIAPFTDWLANQQRCARGKLTDAFESRRFGALVQLLQRLDTWQVDAGQPAVMDAPRRVRRACTQFDKHAETVSDQSPTAALHTVRIRAKRLRYTAEFFATTCGKPAARFAERVVTLQDVLGNVQDGVVSRQHIRDAVESSGRAWPAQTTLALGQLVQFEAQRERELRADFSAAYRRVRTDWKKFRTALRRGAKTAS